MKVKNIIAAFIIAAAFAATVFCFAACEQPKAPAVIDINGEHKEEQESEPQETKEDFEYEATAGYARLTKVNKSCETITIPREVVLDGKTLPVCEIGEKAFEQTDCDTIVLPQGIKKIADKAFENCSAEQIVLPSSLEEIGNYAFQNCRRLTQIALPDNVKYIMKGIFAGCENIEALDLPYMTVALPSMFENAEEEIFYTDNVKRVKVNGKLLPKAAFMDCTSLEEAWLGDDVTMDLPSAFEGCVNLKRVRLPETAEVIRSRTFSGCVSLSDVNFPAGTVSIDSYAFYDCDSLEKIELPTQVKYVSSYAFAACDNIVSVVFDSDVESISAYAFSDLPKLKYIDFSSGNATRSKAMLVGSNNVEEIKLNCDGELRFTDLWGTSSPKVPQSLKKVTVSNTKELNSYYFANCEWIEEIVLSEGLETIGYHAFPYCYSLKSVSLPSTLTAINGYAFEMSLSLQEIVVPDSVEYIGYYAFCPKIIVKLKSAQRKDGWHENCFYYNTVIYDCDNNDLSEEGEIIVVQDGFDFLIKDGEAKLHSGHGEIGKDITVPETVEYDGKQYPVTAIKGYAFSDTDIESIVMPSSVQYIGTYSFSHCYDLKSVTMPGVEIIYFHAFGYCTALENIELPETLMRINQYAFSGCESLTDIVIPSGVFFVSSDAFKNCLNLESIVFENIEGWHITEQSMGELIYYDFSDPVKNLDYFVNLTEHKFYYRQPVLLP